MRNKVALIIPYFGSLPNYFNLWRKSAETNSNFDFFFFTDCEINGSKNIKVFPMTFSDLQAKIYTIFSEKVKCNRPYKLCDYKPVYGLIFQDYITEYDFWGFCGIDLILGNLSKFITDDILDKNDKLYFHGHFTLMRNNKKMNLLFMKKYSNILDYKYAFSTNYSCHFDESGTIGFIHEVDKTIRYCSPGTFFDVNVYEYRIICQKKECVAFWQTGNLYLLDGDCKKEILYIHMQKRKMKMLFDDLDKESFAIFRNQFINILECDLSDLLDSPVDLSEKKEFDITIKRLRRHQIIENICSGALKAKIYRKLYHWKTH